MRLVFFKYSTHLISIDYLFNITIPRSQNKIWLYSVNIITSAWRALHHLTEHCRAFLCRWQNCGPFCSLLDSNTSNIVGSNLLWMFRYLRAPHVIINKAFHILQNTEHELQLFIICHRGSSLRVSLFYLDEEKKRLHIREKFYELYGYPSQKPPSHDFDEKASFHTFVDGGTFVYISQNRFRCRGLHPLF